MLRFSSTKGKSSYPIGDEVVDSANALVMRHRIDVAVSPSSGFNSFVLIVCRLDLEFGSYFCKRHFLRTMETEQPTISASRVDVSRHYCKLRPRLIASSTISPASPYHSNLGKISVLEWLGSRLSILRSDSTSYRLYAADVGLSCITAV